MINQSKYLQNKYRIDFINQRFEHEQVTVLADQSDQAADITYKNKRVIRITNITKLS